MGMNLDNAIYLQRNGYLTLEKKALLDIGPQNVYHIRPEQIREFVINSGASIENSEIEEAINRLVYFSTPRPEERTTLLSEITDLTSIEYNSIDVCPGLKTEILDLNFDQLPRRMRSYYDVVLNFGTTEHIFNQWNCFSVIHHALKVGGIAYHQLPASGYLDHGYYCYTPLFFREMAEANSYVIERMAVTAAGESKLDALQIQSIGGETLLQTPMYLTEHNRIPALNIHVIMRKTKNADFRCGLEVATAHSPVNARMKARYTDQKTSFLRRIKSIIGRAS